ncbi:hypothetical protein [Clostridium lundense]|uniref:hypothetical protein n=1 Tax=Clostridium lundense TaxID=319475 RepID=UPI000488E303|nr:hypothetical protein [Clostridium lundense]
MKFRSLKKRGAALPLAIFLGILLVSLSAVILTTVNNEIKINKASQERIIAKNLAEGAVEHGLYEYNTMLIKDKEVKSFKGSSSIKQIGSYSYSYKAPVKGEEKTGVFIGEGSTRRGSKYKIIASLEIESGKIIQWKEEK